MAESNAIEARRAFKKGLGSLFGFDPAPLRLFCERCDKCVPSDVRWVCGHCEHENRRTKLYSFLNKCQSCEREPASYACPHCGATNALESDGSNGLPAKCFLAPAEEPKKPAPEVDPRIKKKREHAERKEDLEQEIEITQLNVRLTQLKASSAPIEQSPHAALEKSFSEYETHFMGVHMVAKEQRAKNAERYKDDPEMLERAQELVTRWLEERLS
jgi:hypothetical protein